VAGAGFKTFGVGDVLTASDVNTYLMQQAVMNFASSAARGSAIGTATEGMVSYLADTDAIQVYNGSAWVGVGGGFTASTAITATDASWSIPTLADSLVRVIVVGAGGGGGGGTNSATDGGSSSVAGSGLSTVTAAGGLGGRAGTASSGGKNANDGFASGNGGQGAVVKSETRFASDGTGGEVKVAYLDLDGLTTLNITIGAGGTATGGGDGGDGVVIVEYQAG